MVDETILGPEDHDHFLTHGYVVVQNVVPPAVIERAVAELEAEDPDPEFDPAASCTTDIVFQVLTELFGPEYPFAKKRGGRDMARPRKDDVAQRRRHRIHHVCTADSLELQYLLPDGFVGDD